MPPPVSILIPAYNAELYVETAMRSVLAQTFEDWEVVAVDDASSDRTHELLRSFADSRVRVERNDQNLGMTGNWNRCLSLARGELVLKLDADDALRPDAIRSMADALENANVAACGIRSLQCDEALEPFDGIQGDDVMLRNGIDPYRDTVIEGNVWYDFAAMGNQLWSSSAFLFRRDLVSGWDARFGCASDTELIWRVLESGRPVAHRGAVGLLYRVRPGSISDEYRKRGWLTWEAIAANLLSLSRVRAQRPLRRGLRMHYVRLWRLWHGSKREVPEALCANLDDVIRHVTPPPLADVAMTRLRDAVSAA
jgi:glycosyltransferase involved in cell wall biosynthesis